MISGRREEEGQSLESQLRDLCGEAEGSDESKAAFAAGVPLKRLGRPEEIAETIVFVASDKASFISGASFPVNGGKAAL